jgi:hypothetical protein
MMALQPSRGGLMDAMMRAGPLTSDISLEAGIRYLSSYAPPGSTVNQEAVIQRVKDEKKVR